MIIGLGGSYSHPENGMVRSDMEATLKVAERLNEVIAFRSTGPWAKRWIEAGHPTKNFHVKGKSSDWGPQAGLVPFKGVYSKVGHDKQKAADGTEANQKGIESGFAGKITLRLTEKMLKAQLQRSEEAPPRTAIERQEVIDDNWRILIAKRSGDKKIFAFLAKKVSSRDRYYKIYAFPPGAGTNAFKLLKHLHHVHPLEVMTSGEVGADLPMTGDYDLLAVCPRWADYGSRLGRRVEKAGINLRLKGRQQGLVFEPGVGMDNVLDPRLHTMGTKDWHSYQFRKAMYERKGLKFGKEEFSKEHPDMGNLTPRILQCINALNSEMKAVGNKGPMRRVHHNAEALRPFLFGAIYGGEMVSKGEGFPFTSFQPHDLRGFLGDVCTMEHMADFDNWTAALTALGYYVPKNWAWSQTEAPKAKFKRLFGRGPEYLPERH